MGSEQQPKNPPAQDPKSKEPPDHKTLTQTADFFQPDDQTQAEHLQDLRSQGIVAVETQKKGILLPEDVAMALLPTPSILTNNCTLSPADTQEQTWPSGHTYDGENGLPISYGPTLIPIYNAINAYKNESAAPQTGSQELYDQFAVYFRALTGDLGTVWKTFTEERSRSQDDQQLGYDDLYNDRDSQHEIGQGKQQILNTAQVELASITEVQKLEQEMTSLITQFSTLNTELEGVQVTHDLEDTKEALTTKTAEAKSKEATEIGHIETILAFGFSIAAAPTEALKTTVTEVGKAIVKPAAKTLHTHLLKTEDLVRLQAEVDRLSKQRDRLKNYGRALEIKTVKDGIDGVSQQIKQLTKASNTAHEATMVAEMASNRAVDGLSNSIDRASEGLQTCGEEQGTCEAPQGAFQSMRLFSDVRATVMAVSPRITDAADAHLALQKNLQVPTKARQGMAFVKEHGPKFLSKDPAQMDLYKQFRQSSEQSGRIFEFWAETAECDAYNARQIADHVRDHKGQRALIAMQVRFGGDLTIESSNANKARKANKNR